MKVKFIYKVIPVPVFYVDDLGVFGGKSYGVFVRIAEKYKDDEGLLTHELQHCRQCYRTLGISALLYKFSATYRYKAEIECYRAQLTHVMLKDREVAINLFAGMIIHNYGLTLELERVKSDLHYKL